MSDDQKGVPTGLMPTNIEKREMDELMFILLGRDHAETAAIIEEWCRARGLDRALYMAASFRWTLPDAANA